ncbi:MAG TPA: hypothetical protein VFO73_06625 [Candidatus Limnocylindrales bacterium]|nr:hypothetical protein [Candidatus Limnocylindrales bacterium]
MPYNFDDELPDDLSFVVQGETFTMRLVGPEVLAKYEDEDDPESAEEAIERLNARIVEFLIPGDQKRWAALVEKGEIPYRQMNALGRWAWEVQTGRPTNPASPSAGGPGATGATSPVASARSARATVRSRRAARR